MKIRVTDYIANFLLKNKIDTVFTITGGFAMHLNDSFGSTKGYDIYYQHHEQACGYSAVGYSKTISKPSIVCTTAGCAATNAITPCLVAHQDSLPVLFISGQVKSTETIRNINNNNMKLRHYSGADCDIISMVKPITKYCCEINDETQIKEILINTMKNLINGRPGPVWLSIPIDIQGKLIEDSEIPIIEKDILIKSEINADIFINIHNLLKESKRPLIIAGNGIKLGNCREKFLKFIEKYKIPTVVTILGTDIIESNHELYCGKIGLIGDRCGNFTMQNCDLLISLGCRMSQGIVGYRSDWFAREAKIIYIDNDQNELEKNNINYYLKYNIDINNFIDNYNFEIVDYDEWLNKCKYWKNKWYYETPNILDEELINPYKILKLFFNIAPSNKVILSSGGSIVTNVWHMIDIKNGDRFLHSSQGDMGFELPASIGSCIAEKNKLIIPIMGEGSFQLNIQELQTMIQYKLPIKIFLFNNNSYGAIKLTQNNFFKNKFGVDQSSGLSFPDTEKICKAYGISYISIRKDEEIKEKLTEFLEYKDIILCEVFCCVQSRYPRLNAIKNNDGTFTNRPFEDMDPFLDRDEFQKEMIVKIV